MDFPALVRDTELGNEKMWWIELMRIRFALLLNAVIIAVVATAIPAAATTLEWGQNERYYPSDVATSDDGDVLYMATADGIVVLDRAGTPIGALSVPASLLDVAGDRLLVYDGRGGRVSVLEANGEVVAAIDWPDPYVVDVAISGSMAVLIVRDNYSLLGTDRIELLDLDTLTRRGVLDAPLGDLSSHWSLGSGGDALLVATISYFRDENLLLSALDTTVTLFRELEFVTTVTLTDPYPGGVWSVAPGGGGEIYGLGTADLSLGVGNVRDWREVAVWYDDNGNFVETVWSTHSSGGNSNGGIDVDGCFGLAGAMWEDWHDQQYGFKYVPANRNPTCFVDSLVHTFNAEILWLGSQDITKGCNPPLNDRFCPNEQVTRGQMATFLNRALGLPPTDVDSFLDDNGSVFEDDINRLAAAGITKGCNPPTNDAYCPERQVTREQMAAFLVRAFSYTDDGGADLFTDDDGSIFEADIDKLATAGITKGCNPPDNDRFCPTENVTRGQMAAFLHRAIS